MSWVRDCCFLGGSGLLIYGAWLIYEPAGVLLAGAMLVYVAYLWMQLEKGSR